MMKRIAIILWVLLAIWPSLLNAAPRWVHRINHIDWKFVGVEALNVGTSIATSFTIRQCANDHGLGRCVGGDYGPMAAKETIRNSVTVGLIIPTKFLKDSDDRERRKFKGWWMVPAANIAVNGGVIYRNAVRHYPPKEVE